MCQHEGEREAGAMRMGQGQGRRDREVGRERGGRHLAGANGEGEGPSSLDARVENLPPNMILHACSACFDV